MNNFWENIEIIQFIIICLFISYQNNLDTEKILEKDSKYYKFLLNIINYNKITRKNIEDNLKDDINKINHDIFLKNNEYFYIFTNNDNVYVYFFQEKISKKHFIYFNGFNNLKDIKTIFNICTNNLTYENIENILNKNGIFYKIINNKVIKLENKITILKIFDHLYNKIYNKIYNILDENNKINLYINGYSLGGPYSQVFINLLLNKYNNLNIELYNIESWFFGDEYKYNNLKNNIKIYNIYNNKSILYFYNNIFQDYNKCDYILNNDNKDFIKKYFKKYLCKTAPYGIIKYTKDHHLLSRIISEE
jgi:hypothetical protein